MKITSYSNHHSLRLISGKSCYGGSVSYFSDFIILKEVIVLAIVGVVMMMGVLTLINFLINKDCNNEIDSGGQNE
jgi:hypothetical protein